MELSGHAHAHTYVKMDMDMAVSSVAPGIVELPLVKACSEEISRARQKTREQVSELTKTRAI